MDHSTHNHEAERTPVVRMCVPDHMLVKIADVGDRVILFVEFGTFKPLRTNFGGRESIPESAAAAAGINMSADDPYIIKFGGLPVPLQPINPGELDCRNFKCEITVIATEEMLTVGPLKCTIPYCNNDGQCVGELTEEDIPEDLRVYHYPLWEDLLTHNRNLGIEIRHRTSSQLGMYGSLGRRRPLRTQTEASQNEESYNYYDSVDARRPEEEPLLQPQLIQRYWPDTWEMKCWRSCCDPCLRPTNYFTRFCAYFFVTPLTNVAVFSLYYQLYLSEIFHTRFWTRLGHYTCMPFIVLMMLIFFAQWRFVTDSSCYETDNFEILIANGAAVLAFIFLLWYTVWGLVQKTPFMGFFMIVPLFILYILANIYFQVAVKNSTQGQYSCTECWNHTTHLTGHIQFYNCFHLFKWYYNPVFIAWIMSFAQAMSHIFEPKLPPRVSGTDHWMSCADILKSHGFTNLMLISMTQAIFGTVDEFLASARLFPLLYLRVCYSLGYNAKQWKIIQKLVNMSLAYGNPAIDYIGTGGSELPDNPRVQNRHIGDLKRELKAMNLVLTDKQRASIAECDCPRSFAQHYIFLQHYTAKYELQVHAYGPFRTDQNEDMAQHDNNRMERDFPDCESFRNFLQQVRFTLWLMEDKLVKREVERRRLYIEP